MTNGVLSNIAATEPNAAFAGFTFGLKHRYSYFMRTIPNISQNLKRLEKRIRNYFIKSLFNGYECYDMERELSNGIKCEKSKQYQDTSSKIKQTPENDRSRLKLLESSIEPTAYNWFTTIPFMENGFYLNKTTFWYSIRIRYDVPPKYLPSRCICGKIFNLEHALSFKKGDFITLRHNELGDFTANQLSEVCHDVRIWTTVKTTYRWNLSLQYFKYYRRCKGWCITARILGSLTIGVLTYKGI